MKKLTKLKKGDKVAIVSPSFAAPAVWPHDFPSDEDHLFKFVDSRDVEMKQKHMNLDIDEKRPWHIVLDSGEECRFITGVTSGIAGLRMDYSCDDGTWLLLPIDTDNILHSIKCYRGNVVSDCGIDEAWY